MVSPIFIGCFFYVFCHLYDLLLMEKEETEVHRARCHRLEAELFKAQVSEFNLRMEHEDLIKNLGGDPFRRQLEPPPDETNLPSSLPTCTAPNPYLPLAGLTLALLATERTEHVSPDDPQVPSCQRTSLSGS